MEKSTQIRTGKNCVFLLHAHLVFVAKYRGTVFSKFMFHSMQSIFEKICQNFETTLVEFEGERDHVHLLINYPRKLSLSKLINSLKGVSSRRLRQNFPDIRQYYWKGALWSPSYFADSCDGAPLHVIKQYIQNQESPFE